MLDLQDYLCLADWTMEFQHSRLSSKNFIFEISFSVLNFSNQRNIKVITLLLIFISFDDSDFSSSGKPNRDFYFRPTMAAPIMYWRDHVGFCRLYGFDWKSDLAPQFQKALEENGEDFEQIRSTVSKTSGFHLSQNQLIHVHQVIF